MISIRIMSILNYFILTASVLTLLARENQNLSKLLSKGFENQFIRMNIKQEVRVKVREMNKDIFSNQILLHLMDYLYQFIQIKITIQRSKSKSYYLPEEINNHNAIVDEKKFSDQSIDSDIKQYIDIRKLMVKDKVKIILVNVYYIPVI